MLWFICCAFRFQLGFYFLYLGEAASCQYCHFSRFPPPHLKPTRPPALAARAAALSNDPPQFHKLSHSPVPPHRGQLPILIPARHHD